MGLERSGRRGGRWARGVLAGAGKEEEGAGSPRLYRLFIMIRDTSPHIPLPPPPPRRRRVHHKMYFGPPQTPRPPQNVIL